MKKLYCDSCEKCMTDINGASIIGASFEFNDENRLLDEDFVADQLGKYKANKRYKICWSCRLKALGVKP